VLYGGVLQGPRCLAEIISYTVWLYHRFSLSFRKDEELLLARWIIVSHAMIGAGVTGSARGTAPACAFFKDRTLSDR
jgi:hypothetical protein